MYHDFADREIEDLEMDNMRRDAKEQPMKQIELTDEVASVVEHLLDQQPLVVRNDEHGRSMSFLLDCDECANTTIVSFSRFMNNYLVRTQYEHIDTVNFQDAKMLDALTAAWIQFRAKYLVPHIAGQASTDDDELGDLNEHPF